MADEFKDEVDEYQFHLVRAEHHLARALTLLETPTQPNRSFRCQMLLRRAHGIVTALFKQETTEGRR
jgi:cellobiose-specific phosphotransferase system component IIA